MSTRALHDADDRQKEEPSADLEKSFATDDADADANADVEPRSGPSERGGEDSTSDRPRSDGVDRRRHELLFGIVLFAVAFALRFVVAQWLSGEPVWDGHYYDFGARRIAEGHGYSDDRVIAGGLIEKHPWCHYPVGYSAYLAAFYWIFGAHPWVLHFANALTGALTSVVVFLLGREALSSKRARFAGVLTAVHPGLVLYGALVMGEVLAALTVMGAFWIAIVLTRVWGGKSGLRGVALGAIMLGLGALVRPQALLCAPFLAFVVVARDSGKKTSNETTKKASSKDSVWTLRGKAAVIACVVALLPVLPWTARNCAVMDGCALVSTNAGWNLAIGSFPRATGRFETLRSSDGCREVTGQVQQDRCWLEYGIANIKSEPGRWIGLIPAKLSNTFDHESFAVEYLREARPTEWPEARRVAWRTVLTSTHRVLVMAAPLAFIALILPRRRRLILRSQEQGDERGIYRDAGPPEPPEETTLTDSRSDKRERLVQGALLGLVMLAAFLGISSATPTFWPIVIGACALAWLPLPGRPAMNPTLSLLMVLIATTALTHAIFFGDDRYHVVVTPALCLLAAAALRPRA